ncbi:MAG: type II secretion system protein GspE, partial [Ghiorsea sp.]|nr:type II secretion system protein GspE [Ghiorsea sp.]
MKKTRLGDILLRKRAITQAQLEEAMKNMKLNGETLNASLVKAGVFTEDELVKFISQSFGRPAIDLKSLDIDTELTKIPVNIMLKNHAIPVKRKGNVITLAVADPYDINSMDEMAFIAGSQIDVVIVRESALIAKLEEVSQSG